MNPPLSGIVGRGGASICFAGMLLLTACAASPGSDSPTGEASVIYADTQCAGNDGEAAARWLTDADAFARAFDRVRANRIDGGTPPQVAFDRSGVLLVRMGEQPTGGYSLSLASDQVEVEDAVARLRVEWNRPAPDAMVPQVRTSPCLMVRMPDAGFETVEIVDQTGQTRLTTTVDEGA